MSSLHCEFVVHYHGKNTSHANVIRATICYGQHTPVPSISKKKQPKQSNKQLTAQCNFISPLLSSPMSPPSSPAKSLCCTVTLLQARCVPVFCCRRCRCAGQQWHIKHPCAITLAHIFFHLLGFRPHPPSLSCPPSHIISVLSSWHTQSA